MICSTDAKIKKNTATIKRKSLPSKLPEKTNAKFPCPCPPSSSEARIVGFFDDKLIPHSNRRQTVTHQRKSTRIKPPANIRRKPSKTWDEKKPPRWNERVSERSDEKDRPCLR